MSAGKTRVATLEIAESAADVPTEGGVTAFRRSNGVVQRADAGGTWQPLAGGWALVERKVIAVDAQSYTFSNLNGDVDECYQISAELKGGVGAAGGALSVRPNGLTSNQSADTMISDGGGAVAMDAKTEMTIGYTPITNRLAVSYGTLWAKTGSDRSMVSNGGIASIRRTHTGFSRWTDTAVNITSLVIFSIDPPGLGVGTVLTLYKRIIG